MEFNSYPWIAILIIILLFHNINWVIAHNHKNHYPSSSSSSFINNALSSFILINQKSALLNTSSNKCNNCDVIICTTSTSTTRLKLNVMKEPNDNESNFGRQNYWNEFYKSSNEFSWYSPWKDIAPFFMELVPPHDPLLESNNNDHACHTSPPPRVLLPGIGNDISMVDMYDDGYTHLTAFDYSKEGVDNARNFFGDRCLINGRRRNDNETFIPGVDLSVADARNLSLYKSNSFDAVLEKGTLDAIYLSGGKDKDLACQHLQMAVSELSRVVCPGGVVMSITAACAESVELAFQSSSSKLDWEVIRDGNFYITSDGYASNNVDATILAWRRL